MKFFSKMFEDPQTRQMNDSKMFRRKFSDELFLFSSKVQNMTLFSIIHMIRIRFFGPGELIQNGFQAARYSGCTVFGMHLEALEMCYISVLFEYTPGLVENESYGLSNTDSLVCDFSCTFVVTFKPIHHLLLNFQCQVGSVKGNPSGSLLVYRSNKAYLKEWIIPTNKDLRTLATQITYVMMIVQHPDQRGSPILFPVNLLGSRIRPTFGKEMRHQCLLYGPDATSYTPGSFVPFLNARNCPSRVMKFCQATRILSPRGQINLTRLSKWTLTIPRYITWLMFKKLPQTFASHQKEGLLHLLRPTVSAQMYSRSLMQKRLNLESRTSTWEARCLRKADRRQVACRHAARRS